MKRNLLFLLPIGIFVVLVGFFAYRLILVAHGNTPETLPSALIGKPVPAFDLVTLDTGKPHFTNIDLHGKPVLINFFATWCVPCKAEHPILQKLKDQGYSLIGIAYKDNPEALKTWFRDQGNPFETVGLDITGATAIDFGLYGVPETYIVDKDGIIRYRYAGPLTEKAVKDNLLPMLEGLPK